MDFTHNIFKTKNTQKRFAQKITVSKISNWTRWRLREEEIVSPKKMSSQANVKITARSMCITINTKTRCICKIKLCKNHFKIHFKGFRVYNNIKRFFRFSRFSGYTFPVLKATLLYGSTINSSAKRGKSANSVRWINLISSWWIKQEMKSSESRSKKQNTHVMRCSRSDVVPERGCRKRGQHRIWAMEARWTSHRQYDVIASLRRIQNNLITLR